MPRARWIRLFKKLGYWWLVVTLCWFVFFMVYAFISKLPTTTLLTWWLKMSVITNFPFTTAVVLANFDWWGEKESRHEAEEEATPDHEATTQVDKQTQATAHQEEVSRARPA